MFKICFYAPDKSVETVKQAVFTAGAGKIGNYDSCCWQSSGVGQFRPLENSQPSIGSHNEIEQLSETKVELVCEDGLVKQVITALKKAHPYEEPAYQVWRLEDI